MVSQVTKVINKEGFHMRPANMFVKEMTAFQSDVHLILNGKDINAKSIMNIMALWGSSLAVFIKLNKERERYHAKRNRRKRGLRHRQGLDHSAPVAGLQRRGLWRRPAGKRAASGSH